MTVILYFVPLYVCDDVGNQRDGFNLPCPTRLLPHLLPTYTYPTPPPAWIPHLPHLAPTPHPHPWVNPHPCPPSAPTAFTLFCLPCLPLYHPMPASLLPATLPITLYLCLGFLGAYLCALPPTCLMYHLMDGTCAICLPAQPVPCLWDGYHLLSLFYATVIPDYLPCP